MQQTRSNRLQVKNLALGLPVLFLVMLQLFPLLVIAMTSFKTQLGLLKDGSALSFTDLHWGNYAQVIFEDGFLSTVATSSLVALCSTIISVSFGASIAYALAKFRFKGRNYLSLSILCSRMIPPVAFAVPIFMIIRFLGVNDTIFGLVLSHSSFNLPFAIWLMLPFFSSIPNDLAEAALIDGLSHFKVFSYIFLPLAAPGLVVASIFCFLLSWNDFLFSLILTGSNTKTAPLAINAYMSSERIEWGAMTASSMIVMIPIFMLSLYLQKHISKGQLAGGVKG